MPDRRFAAMFGMKSPNYLQLVIQGQRNLSAASAKQIARVLKLKGREEDYFLALVKRQSAKSEGESLQAEKEMFRAIKGLKAKFVDQNENELFREWYHLVVRELVFLPDFEASPEWICHRLGGVLSLAQARISPEIFIGFWFS